jgi:hypothetical protein
VSQEHNGVFFEPGLTVSNQKESPKLGPAILSDDVMDVSKGLGSEGQSSVFSDFFHVEMLQSGPIYCF